MAKQSIDELSRLINDMTLDRLRDFLRWCMVNRYAVTPANIRMWCYRQEGRNA